MCIPPPIPPPPPRKKRKKSTQKIMDCTIVKTTGCSNSSQSVRTKQRSGGCMISTQAFRQTVNTHTYTLPHRLSTHTHTYTLPHRLSTHTPIHCPTDCQHTPIHCPTDCQHTHTYTLPTDCQHTHLYIAPQTVSIHTYTLPHYQRENEHEMELTSRLKESLNFWKMSTKSWAGGGRAR